MSAAPFSEEVSIIILCRQNLVHWVSPVIDSIGFAGDGIEVGGNIDTFRCMEGSVEYVIAFSGVCLDEINWHFSVDCSYISVCAFEYYS